MKLKIVQQIILTCIILLGITNCVPTKRLCQKCPTKDSIVYTETIKLDTLILRLPGDTTILEIPVDLTDYSLSEDNARQRIQLDILKGKLRLITICKDDSLKTVITELEKRNSEVSTIYVDREKIVYKTRPFFIYCTIALFVVVILFAGWIYLKNKAKILGMLGK